MLLDHFHPPLSDRFGWKGFHTQWAAVLTADLNTRLPEGWRAQTEVDLGIEIDVGVVDEPEQRPPDETLVQVLKSNPPTLTIPFTPAIDVVEVRIVNRSYSPNLVGAIELVSPANKDRPEHRDAFVSKCISLLTHGTGLIVIDIVTERRANLHSAIMERLSETAVPFQSALYAVAYRPARQEPENSKVLEIWEEPLELGRLLPRLPLYLRVGPMMPIDLDATYRQTCRELRIPLPEAIVEPQP